MGSTEETPTWEVDTRTLSLVINGVISLLGTVGNSLVIYVAGFRMKRTVNTVWFLNLAVADFFFTAFLIFKITVSQDDQWSLGRVMCKLNTFFIAINLFASVFILLAISVDRCLVTTMVVWAQNKRTVPKAKLVCLVIWIIAVVCSIPHATFRDIKDKQFFPRCGYITREKQVILILLRFIVGFLVPFVGISTSYVALCCRVRRLQTTKKGRPRRMIIAVILAFFVCWLPYHIVKLSPLYSKSEQNRHILRMVRPLTLSLAFLNSCLNPILYVFMCEDFRTKLRQSLCFVLENALAEEHLPSSSSRSVPAHFTRTTHQSESVALTDNKDMCSEAKGEVQLETNDTYLNNV